MSYAKKQRGFWPSLSAVGLGSLFIMVPLAVLKLVVLPFLGLRNGAPPTQAIVDTPIEFVATISITIATILAGYWVYTAYVERRSADELIFRPKSAVSGGLTGGGLIGIPMLILFAADYYRITAVTGVRLETIAVSLVVMSVVLLEELFFRGLLFGRLEESVGTKVALLIQAAIFALAHLANDNWSGPMPLIATFLIGALWGTLYAIYRNIWAIFLHHSVWNLAIFASGLPLSGILDWRPFAPFQSELRGPVIITGGPGGPELSILTVLGVIVALRFTYPRSLSRS